jgi:hypothetical protein
MEKEVIRSILAKIDKMTDEEVEKHFSQIIEEMPDKDFWDWATTWLDVSFVVDIAKNWDTETKREELKGFLHSWLQKVV